MKSRFDSLCVLFIATLSQVRAEDAIRIYTSAAPGSENWTHEEKEYFSPIFNTQVVTNVVNPTLTRFSPAPEKANGTAVIICPGGGFHALSINSEGVDVAKWLNDKGVTGFVLRYRLVPTGTDGVVEMMAKSREKMGADMRAAYPLAQADGAAAVRYVREHASELGVIPNRIGLMGFSAGGSITMGVVLSGAREHRPDFVAPIYAYLGVLGDTDVPKDAPPAFVVAATDDPLGLAEDSVTIYRKWLDAKKPAELHLYSKGGHGFGMKKQK